MRSYRIWVGVVAFIILAAIGGGRKFRFITSGTPTPLAFRIV